MFFNQTRSPESICGVEISDDEYDTKEEDEKYFIVENIPKRNKFQQKKNKRSRFAIGTPTKVLHQSKKDDTALQIKNSNPIKKKSPKIILNKRGRPPKFQKDFFEMIYPCMNCKRKFTTEDNWKKHALKHKK